MAVYLTDPEIEALIAERKLLPDDYWAVLMDGLKREESHRRSSLQVTGERGNSFLLSIRQALLNPLNFSVILALEIPNSNDTFILRRCNGSLAHTNRIERNTITTFHIHMATERYQQLGADPEHYAEATDRYTDVGGALMCMIADCNFIPPASESTPRLI